ncbi:hypothetical protein ACHAPU_006258 [Fusarium lateritium]
MDRFKSQLAFGTATAPWMLTPGSISADHFGMALFLAISGSLFHNVAVDKASNALPRASEAEIGTLIARTSSAAFKALSEDDKPLVTPEIAESSHEQYNMATGLEVLGVVSAVCQLISFAGESVSLCKKVYNGILTPDDDLKNHAQQMSDAMSRVEARNMNIGSQPSDYNSKFESIVKGCKAAAASLEEELQLVTGMNKKNKMIKALHATLRASSHRKKIERLEASLSGYRHLMETEMLSHLCSRSDAIQIQQKQGFRDLDKDTQNLVVKIAQGHTKLEDLVRAAHAETHEAIAQSLGATKAHVTTELQTLENSGRTEAQRQAFLQSLRFPEINQRYNDLMSSRDATFRTVFSSYDDMRSDVGSSYGTSEISASELGHNDSTDERSDASETNDEWPTDEDSDREDVCQTWAPFTDWLQSSEPVFCIRGKPGSGKSTLVKFVIDNETTKQLLGRWSPDVVIVSHFFWKIGSPQQNTIKGLFCSLLYKMIEGSKGLIDHTLHQYPHLTSKANYSDWSTDELENILGYISQVDPRTRCIFIDGLDEVCNKDGLCKATQAIENLLKLPNTKICISSRPETIVMTWVTSQHVPGFLLEDLTRPDMRAFVCKELRPFTSNGTISHDTYGMLENHLIWKAEGVFLWLYLATRNVKAGILHQDSEQTLLSRLQQLPNELEELYTDMWKRMNENNSIYAERAVRYFSYVLEREWYVPVEVDGAIDGYNFLRTFIEQPTLLQIACAESVDAQSILLGSSATMSSAMVKDLCEKSKLDIRNRCAGLLMWTKPTKYDILQLYDLTSRSSGDFEDLKNNRDISDVLLGRVGFIHRTAHDFLVDTEAGQRIISQDQLSKNQVGIRQLKGLLCLIQVLQSEYQINGTVTSILPTLVYLLNSKVRECAPDVMDLVHIVQKIYERTEFLWHPKAPFLSYFTSCDNMEDYVKLSISNEGSSLLATRVLRDTSGPAFDLRYPTYRHSGFVASSTLVDALISMEADPHAYGVNELLSVRPRRMEPFVREGTAFTNLLISANHAMVKGEHLGNGPARETLKVAIKLATTCPDLSTTTLVLASIEEHRVALEGLHILSLTLRTRQAGVVSLLYEVNLKFLLSNLILGLGVDLDEYVLGDIPADRVLQMMEEPQIQLRFVIKQELPRVERHFKRVVFHRVRSQFSKHHPISDLIFTPGVKSLEVNKDPDFANEVKAAYEFAQALVSDHCTEKLDHESALISLSGKGLGLSTMLEVGFTPPLKYIRLWRERLPEFPLTMGRLEALAASQEIEVPKG